MTEATVQRAHLTARFEAGRAATVDELLPLYYDRPPDGLPAHVRAGSALRWFENRLVIVQDDVQALAVRDVSGAIRPVLLPPHPSGQRVFDDTLGNKHEKLDLEACVVLPDGRLVAFRLRLACRTRATRRVGRRKRGAGPRCGWRALRELRATVVQPGERLNIEGAVISMLRLVLFHRGNDTRVAGASR
jgi:hypothetical protein